MKPRGSLKIYSGYVVGLFVLEVLFFGAAQVFITYSLERDFNFFTEIWEKPKICLPIVIAVTLWFAYIKYDEDYD